MFFGPVLMIAVIAAIVAVVVFIIRGTGGGNAPIAAKTPLDILNERFARGEIEKEEFEEKRRLLG